MEITGHITIVQEDRIRLLGDDGRAYLLTLARNADTDDVEELHEQNAHVLVRFKGEPDLDTGIVQKIKKFKQIPGSELDLESVLLSEASAL